MQIHRVLVVAAISTVPMTRFPDPLGRVEGISAQPTLLDLEIAIPVRMLRAHLSVTLLTLTKLVLEGAIAMTGCLVVATTTIVPLRKMI